MKLKYVLFVALFLLIPIISNSTEKKIVATIKPLHSIIMNIVDDEEVFLLLDGNISPHDYHLKPSDMKKIKNADIVFYVDDESIETFLHRALNTIDKPNKVSIFSNSRIKLLPIREGGIWEEELAEDGHDHAHGEYDAHIWLSTNNVIKVTKQIVKKLSEITPSKKSIYKKNAMVFIKKLNDNKKEIALELESVKNEAYIVFHDAYQYFENEFKLNAAGSIALNPEISPTPKRISEIKSKIVNDNVCLLYTSPSPRDGLLSRMPSSA